MAPAIQASLTEAFGQYWMDAPKLHHSSARLRIKLAESRERIAANLGLSPSEVEVVGEVGFGFWSALSGLLESSRANKLTFSQIDREIIHAFGRRNLDLGGVNQIAEIDSEARFDLSPFLQTHPDSIAIWQASNRETGIEQRSPEFPEQTKVFADLTARFEPDTLPVRWDVALWDVRSFGGPEGIAIVGIRNGGAWRTPIPQMDNRRLFGSYSKPLLIAADLAIEHWRTDVISKRDAMRSANELLRSRIAVLIPDAKIVGGNTAQDPRNIALGVPGVIAEEVLREMERAGFLIDAGSACGAGALSPSHVLDAHGLSGLAHLRLTVKPNHEPSDVIALVDALTKVVEANRQNN
jgi:cysteine desulfurase